MKIYFDNKDVGLESFIKSEFPDIEIDYIDDNTSYGNDIDDSKDITVLMENNRIFLFEGNNIWGAYRLYEMAFTLKEAEMHVMHLRDTIFYHVIKIMSYPNSEDVNRWSKDIFTWMEKLQRIKIKTKTKKRLSEGQYKKLLYGEIIESKEDFYFHVKNALDVLQNKPKDPFPKPERSQLDYNKYKSFMDISCSKMATVSLTQKISKDLVDKYLLT